MNEWTNEPGQGPSKQQPSSCTCFYFYRGQLLFSSWLEMVVCTWVRFDKTKRKKEQARGTRVRRYSAPQIQIFRLSCVVWYLQGLKKRKSCRLGFFRNWVNSGIISLHSACTSLNSFRYKTTAVSTYLIYESINKYMDVWVYVYVYTCMYVYACIYLSIYRIPTYESMSVDRQSIWDKTSVPRGSGTLSMHKT